MEFFSEWDFETIGPEQLKQLEERLKKEFIRTKISFPYPDKRTKTRVERKVRKQFEWIYQIRKNLYFNDDEIIVSPDQIKEFTSTILEWPLIAYHSLRRFDDIAWDLTHIYYLAKVKHGLIFTWIYSFLHEYIDKCTSYFEIKIKQHTDSLEFFEWLLNGGGTFITTFDWEDILKQRYDIMEKSHNTRGIKFDKTKVDLTEIIKAKVRSYKRLIKKYKTYLSEYGIRREKLSMMQEDWVNRDLTT